MFFDDNHLRTVAENLSSTKSEKVRLRALNDLLNYAPNEVISIGSWKILCPNLILALGDTNLEIAVSILPLISREKKSIRILFSDGLSDITFTFISSSKYECGL
jgi:hypothetical protein